MTPTLQTTDGVVLDIPLDGPGSEPTGEGIVFDQAPPPRTPSPPPTAGSAGAPVSGRRRGRPPAAEKARVTTAPAPVALDDKARTAGVQGMMQLGAGITLLAGKVTKRDALKADAVAIASVADETAAACVQIARTDPKFAAALDKVCAVGPYGALITIAAGLGAQIARNHRPDAKLPGTVHPDELLKAQDAAEKEAA